MHSFLSDRAIGGGLADTAIAVPVFWLRWCCRPFACRREHAYCQHRLVPAWTSHNRKNNCISRTL